ncbi:molybdopterin-guanine dinucleotide biosynthesis protein B [Bacillus carboniphilus]|uniref:Molybdopterin-guanine dinucleotide biosynthesis protein B n=1 Tax=Bacillus carboniphilus TaxID=86663 RepID=A0ABN0W4C5_9BACI
MNHPFVLQIVGYKNRGKTTLVCKLLEQLKTQGYRVGSIKHDAHQFEMDKPGKDTWKHREAGAETVAITSSTQTAIIIERPSSVQELLEKMGHLDFVLVEGFKNGPYPKITILKEKADKEMLQELTNVIGVASWIPIDIEAEEPKVFPIDDIEGILNVIQNEVKAVKNFKG